MPVTPDGFNLWQPSDDDYEVFVCILLMAALVLLRGKRGEVELVLSAVVAGVFVITMLPRK